MLSRSYCGCSHAGVNGDPRLSHKVADELPMLLKKINVAYLAASDAYGHKDIWNVLPEYFKKTQQNIRNQTDALHAFLDSGESVELGPDLYMPFSKFKLLFKEYARQHSFKPRKFNEDFYGPVFEELKLFLQRDSREYEGQQLDAQFVFGVGPILSSAVNLDDVCPGNDNPLGF